MKACSFYIFNYQQENEYLKEKIESELSVHGFYKDEDPELVISLGGDGTFLSSMHQTDFKKRYISINRGHLGFFSDYDHEDIFSLVDDIINKDCFLEEIPLYDITGDKNDVFFSDIAITSHKTLNISLSIDDENIFKGNASGIVISSAKGSTGFNYSLNSPVCFISSPFLQFSLIAPVKNRLNRNVISKGILPLDKKIFLSSLGDLHLSVDGREDEDLKEINLEVSLKDQKVSLIHFKKISLVQRIKRSIN